MSDGAELLDALAAWVRRYVVLTDTQAAAVALWIVHTHAIEAADSTPYLHVSSAEKRSGKTRLLEVLELLVRQALPTANISDAALFRAIDELSPTLLFDEIDSIFGAKAREREDLRGMLNAGYRRGAVARRMGGARMTTLEAFPVFCGKAFAGIGDLPDTIADRCIRIRMQRRTRDEPVERFRRRDADTDAEPLHRWAGSWAQHHAAQLAEARPALPDELDDRAQDVWEPLLAIADLADADWPARARAAAISLSSADTREDDSLTAKLLTDLHAVFTKSTVDRFKTSDLIDELAQIEESPWGDMYGKPITAHGLSKLLRPFGIKTMPVWVDGRTLRGYKLEQFHEPWKRIVGVRALGSVSPDPAENGGTNAPNAANANGTGGLTRYLQRYELEVREGLITEPEMFELAKLDLLRER